MNMWCLYILYAATVPPCYSAASMVAWLARAVCGCTLLFSHPGVGPPCRPGIKFVKELSLSAVNLIIAAGPSFLPGISGSERATFRMNGAEARTKYL